MQAVTNQISAGERLVALEDDRVVLRVRLVTALTAPLRVVHELRVEAPEGWAHNGDEYELSSTQSS